MKKEMKKDKLEKADKEKEELEYKQVYEKIKNDSELGVDNYVKYLSGGALVVSLTFIGEIVPAKADASWLIVVAWILLVASLIINFLSYFLTIRNCNKAIKDIDDDKECWGNRVDNRNKFIHSFNIISAVCSIAGIIGITVFVSLNINNYG